MEVFGLVVRVSNNRVHLLLGFGYDLFVADLSIAVSRIVRPLFDLRGLGARIDCGVLRCFSRRYKCACNICFG